ncbi:WXG100 family type VII secretion target [Actinoalloteichus spitiensis]|uniref:WXG100 family type VII secretion target n=1 Tax=Actinoalloteichus spitiensis TaxID=252394 RepID=UPI00036E21E8|nr:WXG100 family type VII secretion target [Actinoalloteichus spitiensis]
MSGIKVTFAEIQNASAEVTSAGNQLEETQNALKSRLAPIESSWSGEAMDAWHASQAKWDQGAEEIRTTIAAIGTALSQAAENYQAGEKANAARFS